MEICCGKRELLLLCVFILAGECNHLLNTAGEWFILKLPPVLFSWWEVFSARAVFGRIAKCLGKILFLVYFSRARGQYDLIWHSTVKRMLSIEFPSNHYMYLYTFFFFLRYSISPSEEVVLFWTVIHGFHYLINLPRFYSLITLKIYCLVLLNVLILHFI